MDLYFVDCVCVCSLSMFFFFNQKTAYEMRISDWSSDVCSSDLLNITITYTSVATRWRHGNSDLATAKLTKRYIDGLKPAAKRYPVYDAELKGFGVIVLPSGIISYIVEYRPDGGGRNVAKKKMTLCRVGEIKPDQAQTLDRERLEIGRAHV